MTTEIECACYSNKNGISCYRNSILSILQTLPIFSDLIIDQERMKKIIKLSTKDIEEDKKDDIILNLLSFQLFKIFRLSLEIPQSILNPTTVTKIMINKNSMWGIHMQQDSQEFFFDILDKLREEQGEKVEFIGGKNMLISSKSCTTSTLKNILAIKNYEKLYGEKYIYLTHNYSLIGKIFDFQYNNYKYCLNCNYKNISCEPSTVLALDFPADNLKPMVKYSLKELFFFIFIVSKSGSLNFLAFIPKILTS